MARYGIMLHSSGRSDWFKIRDNGGPTRLAWFKTRTDAAEACRIILALRIDSAFEGCDVEKLPD